MEDEEEDEPPTPSNISQSSTAVWRGSESGYRTPSLSRFRVGEVSGSDDGEGGEEEGGHHGQQDDERGWGANAERNMEYGTRGNIGRAM